MREDVRFESNALCWILMPETLRGLWRQRLRWAMGAQVLFAQYTHLDQWRHRRMLPVYIEYFTSVLWAFAIATVVLLWLLGKFVAMPEALYVSTLLPGWYGVVIGTTCLIQFAVSMMLDSRYERGLGRCYYWMIWYPLAFWMLNVCTTLAALPQLLLRRDLRARWISPDRGLHPSNARGSQAK